MPMWLFQKGVDLRRATVRLSNGGDVTEVARLLRYAARRHYGLNGDDLPILLDNAHAVLLETRQQLYAAVIAGYVVQHTTWLRGVALARGVSESESMPLLLTSLHQTFARRGLRHIFYSGDESSDSWLLSALHRSGYTHETDVLAYEKRAMHIPDEGNQEVRVRPVCQSDRRALMALDAECFEVHWTKDEATLRAAMNEESFFVVAEWEGSIVGYAYASTHFDGQLVHLVRIGVAPSQRGKAVGVRLLAELVAFARRRNTRMITLNTQSYNQRARQLYEWFGFVATGERQQVVRYDLDGHNLRDY